MAKQQKDLLTQLDEIKTKITKKSARRFKKLSQQMLKAGFIKKELMKFTDEEFEKFLELKFPVPDKPKKQKQKSKVASEKVEKSTQKVDAISPQTRQTTFNFKR